MDHLDVIFQVGEHGRFDNERETAQCLRLE